MAKNSYRINFSISADFLLSLTCVIVFVNNPDINSASSMLSNISDDANLNFILVVSLTSYSNSPFLSADNSNGIGFNLDKSTTLSNAVPVFGSVTVTG